MKTERFVIAKNRKEIMRFLVKGKEKQIFSLRIARSLIAMLRMDQPITSWAIYKLGNMGEHEV